MEEKFVIEGERAQKQVTKITSSWADSMAGRMAVSYISRPLPTTNLPVVEVVVNVDRFLAQ